MNKVILALGSNMGDRRSNLTLALSHISEFAEILRKSFIYETPPLGFEKQGYFLNAALLVQTSLLPDDLLFQCKRIEKILGRAKSFKDAPRPLDIDIIFYDSFSCKTDLLEIPHPRWSERDFVISPLLDLFEEDEILLSEYFLNLKKTLRCKIRAFERFGAF